MPLAQMTFVRQVKIQENGDIIAPIFGRAPVWLAFDGVTEPPKGVGYEVSMRRYLDNPKKIDYHARIMIGDRAIDIKDPGKTLYAVYKKESLKVDFAAAKKDGPNGNKSVLEFLGTPDYLVALNLDLPENRGFHDTVEESTANAMGPM